MGKSNKLLKPFYKNIIKEKGNTALLGFTDNSWFDGDLYDIQSNGKNVKHWNINNAWKFQHKKYDTIISLRCPYFAKKPMDFINRCLDSLNPGGKIYADWGLGDHWRFPLYKVGWLKNGEHEWAYNEDNYVWSAYWEENLIFDSEVQKFMEYIKDKGYSDLKSAIMEEVPSVFTLENVDINYNVHNLCLWPENPQLYTLLEITK